MWSTLATKTAMGETLLTDDDAGDHDSLCASVFRSHFSKMVGFARLLGSTDPEATTQEAFLKLHAHLGQLRSKDAAVPYLRSTIINSIRSEHRHRMTVRRLTPAPTSETDRHQPSHPSQQHPELIAALKSLTPRHREALVLRYWLDLSEREMAKEMNVSTGTVKAHVARGMQAMRVALAQENLR